VSDRPAVAVIGLGAMGQRIAERLLGAGWNVQVWNRTTAKADALVARGAALAATPATAAAAASAVITMVADPAALQAVTEGEHGIASGLGPQTALIEMSTVGPAAVARLSAELPPHTPLLDAPVLGSLAEAENGTLTIFVGGDHSVVARWTPLLAALGRPVHVGGLGSGAAAKLVANSALFTSLAAVGEALSLADGLALERDAAYAVLARTPLAAQAERRRDAIEANRYPPRFRLALARKDSELIAEAAAASGRELRLGESAQAWLVEAEGAGYGEADYAAVLAHILDGARGNRRD
jgi:3-hydroxyisobutyrate dehydrogenase-like beta-hydroxyacid dehydrogenase